MADTQMTAAPEESRDRPTGPLAAALLAGGLGTFVLGLFTTLGAASAGLADWLKFNDRVGPLSGKTSLGLSAFFGAWAALSALWWRKEAPVPVREVVIATVVLIALGILMTFPTFFEAFED